MSKELLFDSFSCLDENLLERSETKQPRVPWNNWLKIAACFAVLIGALAVPFVARQHAAVGTPASQFATPADAETAEHEWETSYTPTRGETDNWDTEIIVNGPMIAWGNDASEIVDNYVPMIEYYETGREACYAAPKNGEVGISISLRGAMDEYGDDARYRVVVDLFRDEERLLSEGFEAHDEIDRLAALGYISGLESYYDQGVLENAYFTLHATYDQLKSFAASDDYGYMLFLYAERVPDYEPAPEAVYSGSIAVDSAPTDVTAVTPPFTGAHLTQEQAYADADYGAYLCQPPAGFDEREFLRVDDVLLGSFRRGYDYVDWHVSREANDAAVAAADLTPELVAEHMYRANEAGDTDGLRIMNFCVDYGDIAVRVTAKGVGAEWLYSQLSNLRQS